MNKGTERIVQVAALAALLYFGWQFLSSTVVFMINQNLANNSLTGELKKCNAQLTDKNQALQKALAGAQSAEPKKEKNDG